MALVSASSKNNSSSSSSSSGESSSNISTCDVGDDLPDWTLESQMGMLKCHELIDGKVCLFVTIGYAFDPVASVPGGARGIPAGAVLVSTTEGDVKSGRCIRGVVLILLPISIQQRLQKELRMLKQDPVPGVHALVCHPRPLSSPCSRQQDARATPPPLGHLICFELRHF